VTPPADTAPEVRLTLPGGLKLTAQALRRLSFWAGAIFLLVFLLLQKLPVLGATAAPPGADPANLLSFAWGVTGQSARLAPWAYPPLAYLALRLLLVFFAPLTALKILGFFTWVALAAALWFLLNRFLPDLSILIRLALTLIFVGVSFTNEIFSFGGYPQLYGMAFLTLAVPFEEVYLREARRSDGIIAGASFVGVVFTHHMLAALLPIFWGMAFAWTWLWNPEERKAIWQRWIRLSVPAVIFAIFAAPFYWKYYSLLAGSPLNPNGYSFASLQDGLTYVFLDHVPLWLALLAVGLTGSLLLPRARLSASIMAFTWGAPVLFFCLWEIRILHIMIAGILLALALLFDNAWSQPAHLPVFSTRRILLSVSILLLCAAVLTRGQQYFINTAAYYYVLENDLIPAIDWLREATPPGERVAVTNFSEKSAQMGWWIEGYGKRPAFYVGDPRWLSYTIEKENTAIANQIFDPASSTETIHNLIAANRIQWIFMDKKLVRPGLDALVAQKFITPAYEDGRVRIYHVAGQPEGAQ